MAIGAQYLLGLSFLLKCSESFLYLLTGSSIPNLLAAFLIAAPILPYPSSIMLIITNRDINKNATYSHEQVTYYFFFHYFNFIVTPQGFEPWSTD